MLILLDIFDTIKIAPHCLLLNKRLASRFLKKKNNAFIKVNVQITTLLLLFGETESSERVGSSSFIFGFRSASSRSGCVPIEFTLSAADIRHAFQRSRYYVFRDVFQMGLEPHGMQSFVLTKRLKIAGVVLEIALELVTSQNFLFNFLQSGLADRDTRHSFPGVSRSVPVII